MKVCAVPGRRQIQGLVEMTGRVFSWAFAGLLATIIVQVFFRYLWNKEWIALSELQWHFYGAAMMISLAYAQRHDAHVRVDLFHERFSPQRQRRIEQVSLLILVLPFSAFLVWHGSAMAWEAYRVGESSAAPGGLPARWLIKALLPAGAALLFLSSLERMTAPAPPATPSSSASRDD